MCYNYINKIYTMVTYTITVHSKDFTNLLTALKRLEIKPEGIYWLTSKLTFTHEENYQRAISLANLYDIDLVND